MALSSTKRECGTTNSCRWGYRAEVKTHARKLRRQNASKQSRLGQVMAWVNDINPQHAQELDQAQYDTWIEDVWLYDD